MTQKYLITLLENNLGFADSWAMISIGVTEFLLRKLPLNMEV